MKKNYLNVLIVALITVTMFSGCRKGENDPFFTIHSRDARMSQPWILVSMQGTIAETFGDSVVNTEYTFDGTNLYISKGDTTDSYEYIYRMNVKDNGEVFSEEFVTNPINNDPISESSRTAFWYWGDDTKSKTSVNLDLTGIFASYSNYDIPRLAWNDMTLEINTSDNYTLGNGDAYTVNKNFVIDFEVDLDVLNE